MGVQRVGGDVGVGDHPGGRGAGSPGARRAAALLGTAFLVLPLAACAGEEPSTEPPDPGAPITRSPS